MKITATVNFIKFRGDSGWTVIDFIDETSLRFIGVGMMPSAFEGEKLELEGEWTVHKTYGKQFSVKSFESVAPDSTEAILRFLSSGLIKGIGLPTANAIVNKFGENALDVIEHEPKKLELISGIGKVKSKMIHDSYRIVTPVKPVQSLNAALSMPVTGYPSIPVGIVTVPEICVVSVMTAPPSTTSYFHFA